MREWKSHCHNPGEETEYYSSHTEIKGADASIMPLGDDEWMIVLQVDTGLSRKQAQMLSEKLLSVVEAGD